MPMLLIFIFETNQKQTVSTEKRNITPKVTVTLFLTFAVSLPCVSVSEHNLTCPNPVNLISLGAPAGMMGGRAIPFHLQLAFKACPAMPHSVSVQAMLCPVPRQSTCSGTGGWSHILSVPPASNHNTLNLTTKLLNIRFTSITS